MLFPDGKISLCVDNGSSAIHKTVESKDLIATNGICTGEWDEETKQYFVSNNLSGSLSISVRSYLSKDELPKGKENNIAVITDTKIDGYFISNKEPDEKKQGMIWVVVDAKASNYIKQDMINIGVSYIMQYINGKWVMKDSYIFHDTWQQFVKVELENSIYYKGTDYIYDFPFKESIQEFIAPFSGTYILEVWGAKGGNTSNGYAGGNGGYSKGVYYLNAGERLYVVTGGAGLTAVCNSSTTNGGYNGGGIGACTSGHYSASGGGATHIAKVSGLLSSLINDKEDILIVAGGGGGGHYYTSAGYGTGGSGGGITGSDSSCGGSSASHVWRGYGASQTQIGYGINVGIAAGFGYGGGQNAGANGSGGGAGYFGGGGGWGCPAGGGSGYIANVFSYDKVIKESTSGVNAGAGRAKITLQTIQILDKKELEEIYNETETKTYEFPYTGHIQNFTAPFEGYYLFEVWGAQGGNVSGYIGGLGGYSTGVYYAKKGEILYVVVGGSGRTAYSLSRPFEGGYNGGGNAQLTEESYRSASGGGATHIATKTGLLKSLSSDTSSVLIVAGGGGGAHFYTSANGNGGAGGGTNGLAGSCSGNYSSTWIGYGGTQASGGAGTNVSGPGTGIFGQGGYGTSGTFSGGGGGFYGGGAGWGCPAGGGSGYIANSKLISYKTFKKAMYGGNDTYESAYGITTVGGKKGNGYAKISFIES